MRLYGLDFSGMRLDLYLKLSRLIKRRSIAKEFCDKGRVLVGGSAAKPGREVKPGDRIELRLPKRRVVVEIAELPKGNVAKEKAGLLYRVVEEVVIKEEDY
jgi:ribosomal 50S subunit-recycling heat shock protein